MPRLGATEKLPPAQRGRIDLAIGIVLGVVLGIGVISAFLFLGSEGSIDAPRISGVNAGKPAQHHHGDPPVAAGSSAEKRTEIKRTADRPRSAGSAGQPTPRPRADVGGLASHELKLVEGEHQRTAPELLLDSGGRHAIRQLAARTLGAEDRVEHA